MSLEHFSTLIWELSIWGKIDFVRLLAQMIFLTSQHLLEALYLLLALWFRTLEDHLALSSVYSPTRPLKQRSKENSVWLTHVLGVSLPHTCFIQDISQKA